MSGKTVELGLDTFGDITVDGEGRALTAAQTLRNVVAQGVLAEQVGVDVFSVGEHHRPDFAISAPDVVLAAIAGKTERIRLGTAVTVLSSDDPVRVFQRFATLDAISGGRAEITLGRGSFTESFPLFGYSLAQYDELFEDKLELFTKLLEQEPVTWSGTGRPPLEGQRVYPATEHRLRAWVGVGGSPDSVVRAARYGYPLILAIIGGDPRRFAPFVELYRRAHAQLGTEPGAVGVHSPGHLADSDEQAREELWPHYREQTTRIGAQRGWPPVQRSQFDEAVGPFGSLYVGSPETVARKIANTVTVLGLDRFDLKYGSGTLPHESLTRSIELYGTRVIPRVRELLAESAAD